MNTNLVIGTFFSPVLLFSNKLFIYILVKGRLILCVSTRFWIYKFEQEEQKLFKKKKKTF